MDIKTPQLKPFSALTVYKIDLVGEVIENESFYEKINQLKFKPIPDNTAIEETVGWGKVLGSEYTIPFGERNKYEYLEFKEQKKILDKAELKRRLNEVIAKEEEKTGTEVNEQTIEFLESKLTREILETAPCRETQTRLILNKEDRVVFIESSNKNKTMKALVFLTRAIMASLNIKSNDNVNRFYSIFQNSGSDTLELTQSHLVHGTFFKKISPNGEVQLVEKDSGTIITYKKADVETEKKIVSYIKEGYNIKSFSYMACISDENDYLKNFSFTLDTTETTPLKKLKISKSFTNEMKALFKDMFGDSTNQNTVYYNEYMIKYFENYTVWLEKLIERLLKEMFTGVVSIDDLKGQASEEDGGSIDDFDKE